MSRFGCIGCGNMGAAILRGLAGREDLEIGAYDVNTASVESLASEMGVEACASARALVENYDVILLAVKPHQVQSLLKDLAPRIRTSQILVSIAAGLRLEQLKSFSSGACPVVRVMPNTPAMVGAGVFALCFDDPSLDEEGAAFVRELFAGLGQVHVLDEDYFDAFTALAGSGPAYVFYFMDALVEAGVTLGLTRAQSTRMVKGLLSGSAKLAEESDLHLAQLREMVTSPAGTTIAATNHMDRMAVRASLIDAVRASWARSKELGE